ncbi:MAG: type II secretion system secretin GspD, partial [Desulfobulbaceae bacterium]|nr:type II secretion system secretin GspD [Desulfobulbaceae bacterium]
DRVVTKLIQLKHADPKDVKTILAPLISNTSVVIAHTESGMLIMTDVMSNLHRLTDIINAIDIPSVDEEMNFIQLEHATAETVARTMSQLFMPKGGKQKTEMVKIIPYERTNSLIILASQSTMKKIASLVSKLDTSVPRGEGKIQVYYLQHADAEELVKVLTSLAAAGKNGQPGAGDKAPLLSRNVNIMADDATNSLVITAPRDEYAVIENVITKLDIPRRMVYIEALIMEVKVDKSFEIGVQWGGDGSYSGDTGKVYSGFSGSQSAPYGVMQGLAKGTDGSDAPIFPSGFLLGVMQEGITIGDVFFPSLGAVLNAYKKDSDVNIIATPQILTTDNKKAEIKVGENVPYITSQNTTQAQQDYTNYEYKDVNTTLEITPQINQHNLVKLDILTEIVKLKNPNSGDYRPETLKRTAKTTVIIRDKETIVLGGIIGQDTSSGEYKVPLLGDIPLIGWLFKSHARYDQRTNLFIFITPHIVENPAEVASLYQRKRNIINNSKTYKEEFTGWEPLPEPDPQRATALSDVGFAKLQRKEYSKAKQYFSEALQNDPKNSNAVLNMGAVYEAEGQTERAKTMYRLVLELEEKKGESKESTYLTDFATQKLSRLQMTVPDKE